MFNFSKLCFDDDLQAVVDCLPFSADRDLLYFLEQYKYYTTQQLVDCLQGQTIDSIEAVPGIQRANQFRALELKYGVLCDCDDNFCRVIYDCTTEIKRDSIKLESQLTWDNVQFVAVTPYNFDCLADKSIKPFDAILKLKRILIEAIREGATDVHFEVRHYQEGITYPVLFRINGELIENHLFKLDASDNKKMIDALIEKKTSANALDLLESAGVIASSSKIMDDGTELRISADRVKDGYHYVIRMQQRTTVSMRIPELGFHTDVLNALRRVANKRSGITFITGAIRTGKNTTAFAIANEMSKQPIKIVSYESPIEVLMPFPQVDYQESPAVLLNSIRLAKKQDVNIAFINEIPTSDVAFAVQDLVNSSIHVITTMHMDRVWHLPYKLKEYYGDDYKDVISQINAVFNQKMFGVCCPYCREKMLVDSIPDDGIRSYLKEHDVVSVWKNTGCELCNNTGLVPGGNQPYVEFVVFTDDLVTKLLRCDAAFQMEQVLRNAVQANSLDRFMVDAIIRGDLRYDAVDSLI